MNQKQQPAASHSSGGFPSRVLLSLEIKMSCPGAGAGPQDFSNPLTEEPWHSNLLFPPPHQLGISGAQLVEHLRDVEVGSKCACVEGCS